MNRNIFEQPDKVNCTECKFFDKNTKYNGKHSNKECNGSCTLTSMYIFNVETKCTGFRQ